MSNLAMMMGLGSAAGGVSIADVFSTDLYTGTNSLQTITNGVDLSSNGGFVWTKSRTATAGDSHYVFDTERGASAALFTNLANAQSTASGEGVVAFNSDGFDVNGSSRSNTSGVSYVSWTWRQAPKFFDVLTYTGTGTAGQTVSHNLGSVPGMIIIKRIGTTSDWVVYHRSIGATASLRLDSTRDTTGAVSSAWFNDTEPTATEFSIGTVTDINASGSTYVAYLFAHNEDVIQCGSFSGNDATVNVSLGFQPQFVLVKNSNTVGNWNIYDSQRGAGAYLFADATQAEYTDPSPDIVFNSTGFDASGNFGVSGRDYIYMAIKAE